MAIPYSNQSQDSQSISAQSEKIAHCVTHLYHSINAKQLRDTIFELLNTELGATRCALMTFFTDSHPLIYLYDKMGRDHDIASVSQYLIQNRRMQSTTQDSKPQLSPYDPQVQSDDAHDLSQLWFPALVCPLYLRGKHIGAIAVYEFNHALNALTDTQMQWLNCLCEHATKALEYANLKNMANAQHTAITGIGEAVMHNVDIEKTANTALEFIQSAIPADEYYFFIHLPQQHCFKLICQRGPEHDLNSNLCIPDKLSILALVDNTDPRTSLYRSCEHSDFRHHDEHFLYGPLLALNIERNNTKLATILLHNRNNENHSAAFNEEDREILHAACEQIAVGVENALLYRQLKDAKREAEEISQFKSDFLASMSHEIRTPMNSIIGFTEVLLEDEQNAERQHKLLIIKEAGRNLLHTINDILDFSKIEAGKLDIEYEPFLLQPILEQIRNMFQFQIQQKGLGFHVIIHKNTPPGFIGDEYRISQILLNLVSNACKFTEQGSITVSARITENDDLQFTVCDTGIGMSEAQQQRLFQSFQQADKSTTRRFGGTGLGLSITKQLVELMGGKVNVSGGVGVGSSFKVNLPLKVADIALSYSEYDKRKIGVISGGPTSQFLYHTFLKEFAANMVDIQTDNRDETDVVQIIIDNKLDVLILDMFLPNCSGVKINDLLKRHPLGINIPVLICNNLDRDKREFAYSIVDFISKSHAEYLVNLRYKSVVRMFNAHNIYVLDHNSENQAFYSKLARENGNAMVFYDNANLVISAINTGILPQLIIMHADFYKNNVTNVAEIEKLQIEITNSRIPLVLICDDQLDEHLLKRFKSKNPQLPIIPDDNLEVLLERIDNFIEERTLKGERMVQSWLAAQSMPELKDLLLNNIRDRLTNEISRLSNAVATKELEEIHRHAHAIKGWSGTYCMQELYKITQQMDEIARGQNPDIESIQLLDYELNDLIYSIPSQYFAEPKDTEQDFKRTHQPQQQQGTDMDQSNIRVLVVDDNDMNLTLMQTLLQKYAIEHDCAKNGRLALDALQQQNYDLVFLDMEMPVLDGWETVKLIRQDTKLKHLYVIALTAHAVGNAEQRCLDAGCDEYMTKPLNTALFYKKLRNCAQLKASGL